MELANRDEIEQKFLRNKNRMSVQHRMELEAYLGNPPDPMRVPDIFWQKVEDEERRMLSAFLLIIALSNSRQHGSDGPMAAGRARAWADQHAASVARGYVQHSRSKTLLLGRELAGTKTSKLDMRNRAGTIFGPDRNKFIVSTETTAASVFGGEAAFSSMGLISAEDTWRNRPSLSQSGPCKICKPLDGRPRTEWALVFPGGPPGHPGCVCEVEYVNR